jgi:transposase
MAMPSFGIFYGANSIRNTKSSLTAKYRSLKIRKSHKKTIVAVARKLIRIIYFMLSRHQSYRDPGVDYNAISAKKMLHGRSRL